MTSITDLLPGIPLVESPLFNSALPEMNLSPAEQDVAVALNQRGFAVIDFPDPEIEARIDRIKANLSPRYDVDLADPASIKATGNQRIQDAWKFDDDVKAIAANSAVLDLLERLYGRRAFPFQTLNFPVGTQQHVHSDSIHFSSLPERFMCGVWLAMEDIHPNSGPLKYCAGTHQWPILTNLMLGNQGFGKHAEHAQLPYEAAWNAMIEAQQVPTETFLARKGQALIWASNLLHGGSSQIDPTLTRWSQVTHYFFDDCIYYTPAFSDEPLGKLALRDLINIADGTPRPNQHLGENVDLKSRTLPSRGVRWLRQLGKFLK